MCWYLEMGRLGGDGVMRLEPPWRGAGLLWGEMGECLLPLCAVSPCGARTRPWKPGAGLTRPCVRCHPCLRLWGLESAVQPPSLRCVCSGSLSEDILRLIVKRQPSLKSHPRYTGAQGSPWYHFSLNSCFLLFLELWYHSFVFLYYRDNCFISYSLILCSNVGQSFHL